MRVRKEVNVVPLRPNDEAAFVSAARASRRLHGKRVSPPTTPASFRKKLKYMQGIANQAYCVRRSDNDALVGCIEITQIVRGPFRSAYLGRP